MPRQYAILKGVDTFLKNIKNLYTWTSIAFFEEGKESLEFIQDKSNERLNELVIGKSEPREDRISEGWEIYHVEGAGSSVRRVYGLVNYSEHAIFVEYGTAGRGEFASEYEQPYGLIYPIHAGKLHFWYEGKEFFTDHVRGQEPKAFLRGVIYDDNTMNDMVNKIAKRIEREIQSLPLIEF